VKTNLPGGILGVDSVEIEQVEMPVEIQSRPESLYQSDRPGVGPRVANPGFMEDMGCQGAVNDTQHLARERLARSQARAPSAAQGQRLAKLKEIGKHFGMSDAAVSQTSRRLVLKAEKDPRIPQLLERAKAQLRSGLNFS
jgi:hypothetical protein